LKYETFAAKAMENESQLCPNDKGGVG